MSRRAYLFVSAAIFSLVALLHLRVVFGWGAKPAAASRPNFGGRRSV
jgi:hypothetical protein